jgi:hypothetical protein
MFRISPSTGVLPLIAALLVVPATALDAGENQNVFALYDRPCLSLVTQEDGEFLIASLVLRTDVPVSGFLAHLRFDHDALALVECAPGELMHVGDCVVNLVTADTKGGCTIESRVPEGTVMIGHGEAVELMFRVDQKGASLRLGCVEFFRPDDEQRITYFEDTPTAAAVGLGSSSWASVKALYR